MQQREGISILGYGCMRFTKSGASIDFDKAEKEFMRAYELGVNYFDTAYIYPGSEDVVGRIIEKNGIREKINLATKLPQYLIKTRAGLDKYFDEELKRLRTDYVDYYLMHHMTDLAQWEKLKAAGIEEWIADKKKSGQIRNIGFSFHGDTNTFKRSVNPRWTIFALKTLLLNNQINDAIFNDFKVRLIVYHSLHPKRILPLGTLGASSPNCRTPAEIQSLSLKGSCIGVSSHLSTHRIQLIDKVTFRQTSDRRIAWHTGDSVFQRSHKKGIGTHSGSRQSCFSPGVSAPNHYNIYVRVFHVDRREYTKLSTIL